MTVSELAGELVIQVTIRQVSKIANILLMCMICTAVDWYFINDYTIFLKNTKIKKPYNYCKKH